MSPISTLLAIILVATTSLADAHSVRARNRKLLGATCLAPPTDSLTVPDAYELFSVLATGKIVYFCANSTLSHRGEAFANFTSNDGQWSGSHEYPVNGTLMGLPTWYFTNSATGETRLIWGENESQVKKDAPNGSDIDWSRRIVYGDVSNWDTMGPNNQTVPAGPRATYVIRTETWDAGKPNTTTCSNDIDVEVPYMARYTFVSCDWWLVPSPSPAPSPAPSHSIEGTGDPHFPFFKPISLGIHSQPDSGDATQPEQPVIQPEQPEQAAMPPLPGLQTMEAGPTPINPVVIIPSGPAV